MRITDDRARAELAGAPTVVARLQTDLLVKAAMMSLIAALVFSYTSCATKKYTRKTTAPIQAQVDQQGAELQRREARATEMGSALAAANERVAAAEQRAAEAAEQARKAMEMADKTRQELAVIRGSVVSPPPALPPGIKGLKEVFFATDRQVTGSTTFGNAASDKDELTYGRALVSIPELHVPGELERPWQILTINFPEDSKRHITIASRSTVSADTFFDNIRDGIDRSPEKSAFVFVHGFNVSFDEAVQRVGQLAWDLKFHGPAVAYSWPSVHRILGYASDIEMADWTAPHLETFLRELRKRTGARTIHLIAHSMGSRVLTRALERLADLQTTTEPPRFKEVVLAAPDINVMVFRQLAAALRSTSYRVTIYSSRRDIALRLSAILRNEKNRVGETIIPPRPGFDVIDATNIRTSLLGHDYFADSLQMLNDLSLLLKQGLGPDQRSVSLQAAGAVWVFRP